MKWSYRCGIRVHTSSPVNVSAKYGSVKPLTKGVPPVDCAHLSWIFLSHTFGIAILQFHYQNLYLGHYEYG